MSVGGSPLLIALATPFGAMVLIAVTGRWPRARDAIALLAAVGLFAQVLEWLPGVLAGDPLRLELVQMMPGLSLGLSIEPLGLVFALIASGLWIVATVYSIGYMRANEERHQTRFFACFAGAIGAAIGVALAGDMLTLFLFYEVLSLITYPLVTHHGTKEARRAGRTYLGVLMGSSVAFLMTAVIWTWLIAGSLDFVAGGLLTGHLDGVVAVPLLALYVFGIGKAAVMPIHRWLPAAMVAPTPVSALLHAVAVVKAGVFTVVKVVVYVFGVQNLADLGGAQWLVAVAAFTIVAASIVALRADNLKRRLAYSTVSQLSYVVLAAALLMPQSIAAAVLHIAAHAFGKITLFFAAGSLYTAAHKTEVSQLDGIGRSMPLTMLAFAVGALSMIGLPPMAGFVSKWQLLAGTLAAGNWIALGAIVASTLLNAAYFVPIVYRAFLVEPAGPGHGEAPWPMVLAQSVTAGLTIAFFVAPDTFVRLAQRVAGG